MEFLTPERFEEWKRNGYLTTNACKQFWTGKGCPHEITMNNAKNTAPCKTCTVRKN